MNINFGINNKRQDCKIGSFGGRYLEEEEGKRRRLK
jgi:hypothetical protein